jgi:molybdate transport system substrate-binding protein
VLWSADVALANQDCLEILKSGSYRRIAIANPHTAPYGRAAEEFLKAIGVFDEASQRMVFGENIAQTLQFVASGNATLGLIAAAQVADGSLQPGSCSWKVPVALHSAIDQQGVVLLDSNNLAPALRFMKFLKTPEVAAILRRRGYGVPE